MKIVTDSRGCVSGSGNSFFGYHGWPTVCADENGVAYAVCSGTRIAHVCPFGRVLLYKSRDGGATWSVPSVIFDSRLDDRDAGIVYLGDGKMLFTTFRHPADVYASDYAECIKNDSRAGAGLLAMYDEIPESQRKGGSFIRLSSDFGETVGEEMRVPVSTPHGPVLLKNGNLLYFGKEMYSYGAEKPDIIASYISTDGGRNFTRLGECPLPAGLNLNQLHEPHCAELSDGRIMGLIRTQADKNGDNFTIYKTFSYDGGKNWSEPEATGICGSPPHLAPLSDGSLVLTYGRRMPPYGIYGRLVSPDGVIGEDEFLLEPGLDSDLGYPASVQLPDGTILTVCYKKTEKDGQCRIMSTRWHFG